MEKDRRRIDEGELRRKEVWTKNRQMEELMNHGRKMEAR